MSNIRQSKKIKLSPRQANPSQSSNHIIYYIIFSKPACKTRTFFNDFKSTTRLDRLTAIRGLQERIALYEDMKAYNTLYDLLFDGLYRLSCSLVKSSEVAEEIVSDVFIKLWQIRGKLIEIENLQVYLYAIARNFSLNYLTRNYKNITVSLDAINIEAMVHIEFPADMAISSEKVNMIRMVIQQLPPQCKQVFQLVKEEGLSYKEVAAILGISPHTVRNQIAIAVKKIGEILPAHLQTGLRFEDKFSHS